MYKAIFLDLDGTLLDDNKNISEENRIAIKKAQEKGMYVCLCSGRQIDITKEFRKKADASRYIIVSNGAEIYDCENEEELFSAKIDKNICIDLYNFVKQRDFLIRIDTNYTRYINDMNRKVSIENKLEDDIEKFFEENNILQITICFPQNENINEIINYINDSKEYIKIENDFYTNINKERYRAINIVNNITSKGNAIYGLCKMLKIDTKDVVAFGDDMNDISMMKTVGLGVAMENAVSSVKQYSKKITKNNNQNGVACVINEIIAN